MVMDKDISLALDSPISFNNQWGENQQIRLGFWARQVDGFRRDPDRRPSFLSREKSTAGADGTTFDAAGAAEATANSGLVRQLKGRHLQMIAIGGSIGTGLFVGSGKALANGGPAALVLGFSLVGAMLYCTVHALGEMAVAFPVAGSFSAYATRFLDPAWGFAMGWNYAMQWLVALPLEIVAATITIRYWGPTLPSPAWVAIFLMIILCVNVFFGVRGYAESEFAFSIIKVIAVIGFIILGVTLNIGGGPAASYIGGKYWVDPGAFNNGFRGLCSVFVTAAFAFAGTELVGLAAAETQNPRKTLPNAIKQVFWRITIFYVVALLVVGLIVPYNDPRLLTGHADTSASPFVIAIRNAGIAGLDSVMNAVIMIAVLSVGNSAVFGASRTIAALADQGQAPKILSYVDKRGRPIVAILFAASFGMLAFFVSLGDKAQTTLFTWLLALSGLSSIFTWSSICLAHIRFRKAWRVQGHTLDELAFRSQPGLIGSWIGFVFNILVLAAQFWVGFAPVGYQKNSVSNNVENFFEAFLCLPILLVFYVGYKIAKRTKVVRSRDMDIDTGGRVLNIQEILEEERRERKEWPKWKKVYKFFC